jgi:hypothetical protein
MSCSITVSLSALPVARRDSESEQGKAEAAGCNSMIDSVVGSCPARKGGTLAYHTRRMQLDQYPIQGQRMSSTNLLLGASSQKRYQETS